MVLPSGGTSKRVKKSCSAEDLRAPCSNRICEDRQEQDLTNTTLGLSYALVLSNLFYLTGHTKNNHEAPGCTSKLKGKDYNLLNINILYLCNCNSFKSGVVHNVCHASLDTFLPIPCHKTVTNLGPILLSMSHFQTKKLATV